MLTRHRRFNISYQPHIRPFHSPFTPLSLPFHSPLFPKHICFRVRKLIFYPPKDGLLHPERPSFTTPNIYLSEVKSEK